MTASFPDAQKWQPIKTAPKDKYILLFPCRWGGISCDVGVWDEDRFAKKPRPYWRRVGQTSVGDDRNYPPTHWMPLPSPPQFLDGAKR